MSKKLCGVLPFIVLFVVPFAVIGLHLALDEDWHGFPAVTRCRGCDKRIWEWQQYERRESKPTHASGDVLFVTARMSSLYHVECPTEAANVAMLVIE